MPLDPDLLRMMTQTVTIEPFASADGYSKPSYGMGAIYRAYVDANPKMIRNLEGQIVMSSGRIYMGDVSGATVKSRVTLPDGSQPPIIMVNAMTDEKGPYAEVIYV